MTKSELKALQEMELMLKESERSRHLKYQQMQQKHGKTFFKQFDKNSKIYDKFRSKTNAGGRKRHPDTGSFNMSGEDQ